MRTRLIRRASAGALALALVGAPVALADDISNSLDTSIDAVAEVMSLNVGGSNGTTTLYVKPQNGDGGPGCNLKAGTTLVLAVASSNTEVATVSPKSVTFTSCDDKPSITVTPVAAGAASITVAQTSNDTGGTFTFFGATFAVNVAPPSNTAPTIAVTGVTEGATYVKGSVPDAVCELNDAEDGSDSFPATLSVITGTYASDGIGSQTASCSYTDKGGLTVSESMTYSIVDPSAPAISYVLTPAAPDGLNGWYKGTVILTWTVTESESPKSLLKTDCVDQTITNDQQATTYSCSATSAGGSAGPVTTVAVKRDATAPSVGYTSATGTQGENGWYISPVTATFTATDAFSGPVSATNTAASGATQEGSTVTIASPAFSDAAGNSAAAGSVSSDPFKIDLTDPAATFDSTIGSVYFGQVPAAPTCTATDAISGPASCVVTGYSTSVGPHTLTATAKDQAGHTKTETQTYFVNYRWDGFLQPINDTAHQLDTSNMSVFKAGSTVPVKFQLKDGNGGLVQATLTPEWPKPIPAASCPLSSGTLEQAVTEAATGGSTYRWDATSQQYIYNWSTKGVTANTCWVIGVTLDDGTTQSVTIGLRK